MKRSTFSRKKTVGILAAGTVIYLFTVVFIYPHQPYLPGLNKAQVVVDRVWESLQNQPVIYPSQKNAITDWLAVSGNASLEGLASIKNYSCYQDNLQSFTWPVNRRKIRTWVIRGNREDESVSWLTATVPRRQTTTFIFSGALGNAPGKSILSVSGKPVITFNPGQENRPDFWEGEGHRLRFFPLREFTHESGIFCLTVPKEMIKSDRPLEIEVKRLSGTQNHSFFALHDYRNTHSLLVSTTD